MCVRLTEPTTTGDVWESVGNAGSICSLPGAIPHTAHPAMCALIASAHKWMDSPTMRDVRAQKSVLTTTTHTSLICARSVMSAAYVMTVDVSANSLVFPLHTWMHVCSDEERSML